MTLRKKTALLIGVAHEARRRGLRPRDRNVREMLRLATSFFDEGSAPPHTAARWAGTLVVRDRCALLTVLPQRSFNQP